MPAVRNRRPSVIASVAAVAAAAALFAFSGCAGIKSTPLSNGAGGGGGAAVNGGGGHNTNSGGGQNGAGGGPASLPDAGACVKVACTQPTGQYCGKIGDGCNGSQDCGTCPGDQICEKGVCVQGASCVPATCPTTGDPQLRQDRRRLRARARLRHVPDWLQLQHQRRVHRSGLRAQDLQRPERRSVLRHDWRRLRRRAELQLHRRLDLRRRWRPRRLRRHDLPASIADDPVQSHRRWTVLRHDRQRLRRRRDLPDDLPDGRGLPGQRRLPRVDQHRLPEFAVPDPDLHADDQDQHQRHGLRSGRQESALQRAGLHPEHDQRRCSIRCRRACRATCAA